MSPETPHQQAGTGQQDQREARTAATTNASLSRRLPLVPPTARLLERALQVDPVSRGAPRDQSEQDSVQRGDAEGEYEHHGVNADPLDVMQPFLHDRRKRAHAHPDREQRAAQASDQRDSSMLSIRSWRTSRRGRRRAQQRTAISRDRPLAPREQEVGEVGAGDEQHHAHAGKEHEERVARAADEPGAQRRRKDDRVPGRGSSGSRSRQNWSVRFTSSWRAFSSETPGASRPIAS